LVSELSLDKDVAVFIPGNNLAAGVGGNYNKPPFTTKLQHIKQFYETDI